MTFHAHGYERLTRPGTYEMFVKCNASMLDLLLCLYGLQLQHSLLAASLTRPDGNRHSLTHYIPSDNDLRRSFRLQSQHQPCGSTATPAQHRHAKPNDAERRSHILLDVPHSSRPLLCQRTTAYLYSDVCSTSTALRHTAFKRTTVLGSEHI